MKKVKSNRRKKRYNRNETKRVKTVKVLDTEKLESINEIENLRNRGIILLLLHTGLRVSELVNLNYGDIYETGLRKVKDSIQVIGKGNKLRIIPLNETAKQAIRLIDRYNRKRLFLKGITQRTPFLISQKLFRMTTRAVEYITKKEIGVHPHVLRHTCLTLLRRSGVPLEVLQKIAGHENIQTTAKYYLAVTNLDLEQAMQSIA